LIVPAAGFCTVLSPEVVTTPVKSPLRVHVVVPVDDHEIATTWLMIALATSARMITAGAGAAGVAVVAESPTPPLHAVRLQSATQANKRLVLPNPSNTIR
jgi:hypothetical protein